MLENATASLRKPWGTMSFRTELGRDGPSQYGYFDVGTLF